MTVERVVSLEDAGGRTRMTMTATFRSLEDMERLLEMGVEDGLRAALGQIDDILREPVA